MKLLDTFNHGMVNVIPTASNLQFVTFVSGNRVSGLFQIFAVDQLCLRKLQSWSPSASGSTTNLFITAFATAKLHTR